MIVEVPIPVTDCITETPPVYGDIFFDSCENFEACLTMENAGKLVLYLNRVQMYMEDWYSACGKKETIENA